MQITDLTYLENVPENELILGSAGMSVTSEALASGSESSAFASANTTATTGLDGYSTANGTGLAEAFGDDATTNLTIAGDGDIVIGKTKVKSSKKSAVVSGFAIAIDLPSNLTVSSLLKGLF
ncbi:hypothetical protein [Nostoc sp. WHI]|uniref:hypothetical protein n=1 Tax=Nostoc sp. WHI TaxID=2650611 RepID=UPI0018C7D767|nr:hypothetical protein [Nostoc sp. WHI]MBG1265059.1 hypothetical protein [Nostoc sp. WHI]